MAVKPIEEPDIQLLASWRANAGAWTAAVRTQSIESRRLVTDAAILDQIRALAPRRVLDMGCGEGWLVRQLSTEGITAVGLDASAELIAAASAAGPEVYHCLSYAELAARPALAGQDHDLIVANFALLAADLDPLLAALPQCLTPGGRLLIQTLHPLALDGPYCDGWRQENFHGFGKSGWTPMPWYFRTITSWLALLQRCGWRLEQLDETIHPHSQRPLSLLLQANHQGF